jgi:hypothetical protein
MTDTPSDFPFMETLPKREQKKVRTAWDQYEEFKIIVRERGGVIPPAVAAGLGGVSRERISQLMQKGTLERVELGTFVFITADSFSSWVVSERKSGRPVTIVANIPSAISNSRKPR